MTVSSLDRMIPLTFRGDIKAEVRAEAEEIRNSLAASIAAGSMSGLDSLIVEERLKRVLLKERKLDPGPIEREPILLRLLHPEIGHDKKGHQSVASTHDQCIKFPERASS